MNYREAMDFLKDLTKFGMNFGLERILKLMELLDNPHTGQKVVHVGGTNGKGSTSAMIASMCQAAGFKVGLFTSPHLHAYTERIRINGEQISEERIAQLLTRLRPLLEQMVAEGYEHPTEFEVSTALALLHFYEQQVDLSVVEVGLGGAIDSTNVVHPLVAVITNVAMDHMDYLGETIAEIARVKAGIVKYGTKVVTAVNKPEAWEILVGKCRKENAELIKVGRDVTWEELEVTGRGSRFNLQGIGRDYHDLFIPLVGRHQFVNAATAVTAVELLGHYGLHVSEKAIRSGLATVSWPARLEMVRKSPQVLVDAAHNVDGAATLHDALTTIYEYQDLILVIGMLSDKEREKVLAMLAPLARAIVVTRPNSPRSGDWHIMAQEAQKYCPNVCTVENIAQAVDKGLSLAGENDIVCVTGSFYMVAEARNWLLRSQNEENK